MYEPIDYHPKQSKLEKNKHRMISHVESKKGIQMNLFAEQKQMHRLCKQI